MTTKPSTTNPKEISENCQLSSHFSTASGGPVPTIAVPTSGYLPWDVFPNSFGGVGFDSMNFVAKFRMTQKVVEI